MLFVLLSTEKLGISKMTGVLEAGLLTGVEFEFEFEVEVGGVKRFDFWLSEDFKSLTKVSTVVVLKMVLVVSLVVKGAEDKLIVSDTKVD